MNDSFPPIIDGVANAVLNYAENICALGGSAAVVTPNHPEAQDGAFSFPVMRYPSIDMRKRLGYMAGYPFSPELARRLQDWGAELIHSHCPIASTALARELRFVLKAPIVFTYHTKFDIDIARAVRGKLLQEGALKMLAKNISSCDEVWVVSRGAGENLRSIGYEGDYTVMENGVDIPRGRLSRERADELIGEAAIPEGLPVFLFVGRLMWYKGIDIILDALAALSARGQDFRMVFVGDGADRGGIIERLCELKLENRCVFTGAISERDELRAWYSRADLFLFPSTFDTNGLVVREAAACSLASVLIEGSCAAEGVADGETGFLIKKDAAAMAELLASLCQNPEKMRRVGENAASGLYISWRDSVSRAYERYGAVIEKYKSGGYPERSGSLDDFLSFQGELMEGFSKAGRFGKDVVADLNAKRAELHDDLKAKGAELYGGIREQGEALRSAVKDGRDKLRDTRDELWSKMSRYL
jgi:glycosyltransferase involved in cell wall biosynthesis